MGLPGSITAVGSGWRGGMIFTIAGLSDAGAGATVWGVMMGLRMYVFMNVIIYGLNCVPSVAPRGAAFNPSWHLTAVGAEACPVLRGSAIAVPVASRRWL